MISRGLKRTAVILWTATVVAAGGVITSASAQAQAQPIKWDFMSVVGLTHPVAQIQQQFADAVKQKTNGRLQITIRPPGELPYKGTETLRTVGSNKMQIGDPSAFIAGESKAGSLPMLPFLITNTDELVKAMPALRPHLDKDLARYGVRLLWYYNWPIQTSWGRGAPVRSFADFKGRKVRSSSPEQAYLMKQLGAEPVSLTNTEIPEAMNRGLVDIVATAGFNAYGAKWGEFLQWGYLQGLNAVPAFVVVNAGAMDALPPDLKAALDAAARETQGKMLKEIEALEAGAREKLNKEFKVQLISGSPADAQKGQEIVRSYWATWAKDNNMQEAFDAVRKALGR